MALTAFVQGRNVTGAAIMLFLSALSCDHGQRLQELERWRQQFTAAQVKRDTDQDQVIEDVTSKLACDNAEVRNFIKRCTSEEVCDDGKVVNAIRNMKGMDHVMLRVPYYNDQPLSIDAEDRKAQVIKLILKHAVVAGSTKLLVVAIPSLDKKQQKGKPTANPTTPQIDYTKLKTQAFRFRNALYEPEFNLPKTVKHLEPQVPRCDTRSVGLVQSFQREVPDDHLLPHEQKIQYPYVDLIIFLVEC